MDSAAFPPLTARYHSNGSSTMMMQRITKGNGGGSSGVRKGMMAFFETFRNKQTATS